MKDSLYLSRAFVEFGPFSSSEMLSFYGRGMLKDSDYVGSGAKDGWVHVDEWAKKNLPAEPPAPAAQKAVSPTPQAAAKEPEAKPAAKKAAPAKKAKKSA